MIRLYMYFVEHTYSCHTNLVVMATTGTRSGHHYRTGRTWTCGGREGGREGRGEEEIGEKREGGRKGGERSGEGKRRVGQGREEGGVGGEKERRSGGKRVSNLNSIEIHVHLRT